LAAHALDFDLLARQCIVDKNRFAFDTRYTASFVREIVDSNDFRRAIAQGSGSAHA
jgi:hypothetical protein